MKDFTCWIVDTWIKSPAAIGICWLASSVDRGGKGDNRCWRCKSNRGNPPLDTTDQLPLTQISPLRYISFYFLAALEVQHWATDRPTD